MILGLDEKSNILRFVHLISNNSFLPLYISFSSYINYANINVFN